MELPGPDWAASDPAQAGVYEAFLEELKGPWVSLYRSDRALGEHSIVQYSALLPADRVGAALQEPSWEVSIGSGGSGFTQYFDDGETTTVYERYPENGVELLVNRREFHGVRASSAELVEEFRLLFDLWEDRKSGTLFYFDESGSPVKAAVIEERSVRVLSSLVRRYQAAKQMYLALYLDSTLWSPDLEVEDLRWEAEEEGVALAYYRGDTGFGESGKFSRLFGKRLLPPPAIETCGLWPFERPAQYEDFLIGLSEEGEEVCFTSDPERLANYFGANPGSPNYLTPVFFRREVLSRYYADPDRFSVEDGYLRCTGLWGLRLDNDQSGHIMVFLGDLGRDLPHSEARYWRSFNIPPPEEGPSETLIRRAFGAEFANPKSPDLRFPHEYRETNEAWESAYGWPLYKPLHDDDAHVLSKLHVPVSEGAAEFDEQILYMAKLVVDSLNVEEIGASLGEQGKGEGGLAKLEAFLDKAGVADARILLKPFAEIQGLRSRGAAHRKGTSFDIEVAIGELGRPAGFTSLLEGAIATLESLRSFAERQAGS